MNANHLVRVENYKQYFKINKSLTVKAVQGLSFNLHKGEILGLVGESGSGKSTVAKAIMGLHLPTEGKVYFKEHLLSDRSLSKAAKSDIQKNRQIIFQDSAAALNPRMQIGEIIVEPLRINGGDVNKKWLDQRAEELLPMVGLDSSYKNKYPNELSGGQRQRVGIARSISINPELIVADEPVASLDVSIQTQIVSLFQELQKEKGFSFLFIAHDLSLVQFISNRVGVMCSGKLVELAPTKELFNNPIHPYTQSLLSAIPVPDPIKARSKKTAVFDKALINLESELKEINPGHFVLA